MKYNLGMPSAAKELLAVFDFDPPGEGTRWGRLILVLSTNDEYVVSVQYGNSASDWDKSWAQGHYFDQNLNKARAYFLYRCLRELAGDIFDSCKALAEHLSESELRNLALAVAGARKEVDDESGRGHQASEGQ